jgi:hypothetical protein
MRRDMIVEITDDEADSFDGLDETYRRGSLTVGSNYMQIDGVDYNVSHVTPNHEIAGVVFSNTTLLRRCW